MKLVQLNSELNRINAIIIIIFATVKWDAEFNHAILLDNTCTGAVQWSIHVLNENWCELCSMHWPLCDAHKFIRYLYLEFCLLFSLSLVHFALLVYKFAWVSKKSVHNDVGGNFSNFNTNKQCKMIQLTICNIRRFSVFRFFFFFFSHSACEINCKLF